MFSHKLRFFTMLATIIAFIAVGRSSVHTKGLNVPTPNSWPHASALPSDGSLWYGAPPTSEVDRSDWVRAKNGIRPAVFLPVQSFLPTQSRNAKDLGAGKLLVASRELGDPNFAQTVVLLVRYDAGGVVGLILNRRTDIPMSRVLEGIKAARGRSDPVYSGGPVEPSVFALLQSPAKVEGAEHIFGAVYMISTKPSFEQTISARPDPGDFHVYLGAAGWTNDQLRKELELGAWFIFPADAGTVFDSDPDSLWPQMIKKTELKFAGNRPADADRLRAARSTLPTHLAHPLEDARAVVIHALGPSLQGSGQNRGEPCRLFPADTPGRGSVVVATRRLCTINTRAPFNHVEIDLQNAPLAEDEFGHRYQ